MEMDPISYQSEINDLEARKLLLLDNIDKHFEEKHKYGTYSTCHRCIEFGAEFRSIEILLRTIKMSQEDK